MIPTGESSKNPIDMSRTPSLCYYNLKVVPKVTLSIHVCCNRTFYLYLADAEIAFQQLRVCGLHCHVELRFPACQTRLYDTPSISILGHKRNRDYMALYMGSSCARFRSPQFKP